MLLRSVDVFDIYVEPYIYSGFRLPNQPYSYYFRSLFFFHNETFSIWIHLIGSFVLVIQLFEHLSQFLLIESHSMILCIYMIYNCFGACVMLLCSAQAHLFHSRTLADHLRSFYLDYFGINFYGFTSGISLYRFSYRKTQLINETWYCLTLSLLTLYSISIACFCKTFYRRPYPISHKMLQCSGVLIVYLYQMWPICLKYLYSSSESTDKGLYWHSIECLSFLLSGLIFLGRFPERFSPGLFDFVGQSHHGFHLLIFLMSYSQGNAVFEDIRSSVLDDIPLNFVKDILLTLIILICQLISISLWFRISRPTIERRYQNHLKE